MHSFLAAAFCFAAIVFPPPPSAPVSVFDALAVSFDGSVTRVDTTLGVTQSLGILGFGGANALARDPLGRLWTLRIDLDGASVTQLGAGGLSQIVGLEFLARSNLAPATPYCTAQTNSQGCAPIIEAIGPFVASSSTSSGFSVNARNVVAGKSGLLLYGTSGRNNVPFLGGFLCAKAPLRRTTLQSSGGVAGCTGTFAFDFNAHIATGIDPALITGEVIDAQYWSRDPAAGTNTNLSGGLEFHVFP